MSQRKPLNTIYAQLAGLQLDMQEEMTKEKAIKIMEDAIKKTTEFCAQEAKDTGVQDDKGATSAMFLLGSQAEPAIDFLSEHIETDKTNPSENMKLKKLISDLREKMATAVQLIQEMRNHNDKLATKINVAAHLNELAKKPDVAALRKFIKDFDRQMKLEYLSHALRYAAATGQADNIDVLVKSGANILDEGPTSKQLPLHHAVINGHPAAVRRLLRSVDSMDYFDPVGQLQKPDASGKTPIDHLSSLSNLTVKNAIRAEILAALNEVPNNRTNDNSARETIRNRLAKPFTAEVVAQQAATAASPVKSFCKK